MTPLHHPPLLYEHGGCPTKSIVYNLELESKGAGQSMGPVLWCLRSNRANFQFESLAIFFWHLLVQKQIPTTQFSTSTMQIV